MNLIKNMEAVFVAVVIITGAATFATAKVAPKPAPAAQAPTQEHMVVITVSTKRLTAAQKAELDS